MKVRAATVVRVSALAVPALAGLVLAGCGDGGPTEPPVERVASVSIDVDASVMIVNGTPTISVGDSADFDATATDSQGRTTSTSIAWSSLDPSIASVNDTGTAVGLSPGQASIVASADNGVADTAALVVQDTGQASDQPNLRAVSLDLVPRGVLTSGTIEARAVVENAGQEAGAFRLTIGEGGTVLAGVDRDGLDAGATDTVAITGLGPFAEGTHTLTLRVDTENQVSEPDETDNATRSRLESWPAGYDIELRFVGGVSSTFQTEVREEMDRWSRVVSGDVSDVNAGASGIALDSCFSEPQGIPDRMDPIDDLLILVRVDSIDGFRGTLARAGPCFIRSDAADLELPPLPVVGVMEFDEADVDSARADGFLRPVILHEAAHVLGFGSLWNSQGGRNDNVGPFQLLEGEGGIDPRFVGAFAIDRFKSIGGDRPTVPVENAGLPGTRGSHWRESVFVNELMTGFIGTGANPLSVVTIASLGDMFYSVDLGEADPFSLPAGGGAAVRFQGRDLGDDVIDDMPLFGVDARGRVTRIDRRTLRPLRGSEEER